MPYEQFRTFHEDDSNLILHIVAAYVTVPVIIFLAVFLFGGISKSKNRGFNLKDLQTYDGFMRVLPQVASFYAFLGVVLVFVVNIVASVYHYLNESDLAHYLDQVENAVEYAVFVGPISLLVNVVTHVYRNTCQNIHPWTKYISAFETICILITVPFSLAPGIEYEGIQILRTVCLTVDIVLVTYLHVSIAESLSKASTKVVQMFSFRWAYAFYSVLTSNIVMTIKNFVVIFKGKVYYQVPFFAGMVIFTFILQANALLAALNVFLKGPILIGKLKETSEDSSEGKSTDFGASSQSGKDGHLVIKTKGDQS